MTTSMHALAPLARWLAVRAMIGAACVATMLSLAQLSIHLLTVFYSNIPPYTGAG